MIRPTVPTLSRRTVAATVVAATVSAVAALSAGAPAAHAADPKIIGSYGAWTAYSFDEKAGKVCYMASQPEKAEGDYSARGDIFALVTHRPGEKSRDVVSIVAGYPYKEGSEVELSVGKKDWNLFTQGERAWARDSKTDQAIVESLRKGSKLVVKGTSARGTLTTDTYSLAGSNNAYEAISKACSVKID